MLFLDALAPTVSLVFACSEVFPSLSFLAFISVSLSLSQRTTAVTQFATSSSDCPGPVSQLKPIPTASEETV
ncbi:hypothetical protein EI94DRAFT_1747511, partial [Lactarius quietus]